MRLTASRRGTHAALRLPEVIRDASRIADIPKSTLLAIARIRDEALAAFETAKSGEVSVRAAKLIQKGETTAKAHAERPQDNVKKATNAILSARQW